jgi:hypothetical protein
VLPHDETPAYPPALSLLEVALSACLQPLPHTLSHHRSRKRHSPSFIIIAALVLDHRLSTRGLPSAMVMNDSSVRGPARTATMSATVTPNAVTANANAGDDAGEPFPPPRCSLAAGCKIAPHVPQRSVARQAHHALFFHPATQIVDAGDESEDRSTWDAIASSLQLLPCHVFFFFNR